MALILILSLITSEIPAKITYLSGNVIIERGGKKYSGVLNASLFVDDIITTYSESICEIQFSNYSLVRLEPNSSIRIERKEETPKRVFHRIFASLGDIITKVTKMNKGDEFEIRTDAAQAFIRGTVFKTSVEKDGTSSFAVFTGKIKVKSLMSGAKEILLDKNFKSKIARGELKPIVEKLPIEEIQKFAERYNDFLNRGRALDALREKAEKEIEKQKKKLLEEGKKKAKGCIFW
uniref:FecR protein domain-containing protein n=1 Tax=candidate division WOR-3 bacterium TaxID=2052148 RepID=A0A7C4TFW8_UNCW3